MAGPTLRSFRMDLQFNGQGSPNGVRVAGQPGGPAGQGATRRFGASGLLDAMRNKEDSEPDSEVDEE